MAADSSHGRAAEPLAGEQVGSTVTPYDRYASEWLEFRKYFPVRAPQPLAHTGHDRPTKDQQQPWHRYRSLDRESRLQTQEWLFVPFLVPVPTRRLPMNRPQHNLWEGRNPATGGPAMHWTNIERIRELCGWHPMVSEVEEHKATKAEDRSIFNAIQRATKGHQSPHDLMLTIAASGAKFRIGVTVNDAHKDLLSLWWCPGKGLNTLQRKVAEAIFFDLVEAEHVVPAELRAAFQRATPAQPPPFPIGTSIVAKESLQ